MESNIEVLKQNIIEALNLDLKADQIPDDSPIFGEGLGLDSIDALELIVMLEKKYGIKIKDEKNARAAFASVKSLNDFIISQTL